jgi:hypothetical protein
MSIRLAFGVTAGPRSRCWAPTSAGGPLPVDDRSGTHPPGAPVAVGPADADPATALEQLTLLVAGGTEVAAGAGVDLGHGFTSARLAGAQGDRRDAILAVLKFLGTHGAHRLGDRTAVLVALFGLSATKRVGAAADTAIAEERWGALHLASAVSDLLGPEQLEQVLALPATDGTDPFPHGAASTLAEHLSLVLTRYQRPRRLALIVSLWHHVCERQLDRRRVADLAASQTRADRIDRLRERHRTHLDEPLLERLAIDTEPTLAAAARWRRPEHWPAKELRYLLHDAIAATALLRFARTLSDEGLATAEERHREELTAADACLTKAERTAAARRTEGAYSHPARPGRYVHDVLESLRPNARITNKIEAYVRERTAMARNYGVVVLDAVTEHLEDEEPLRNCWDGCRPWQVSHLGEWRAAAGFTRAPNTWEQPPLRDAHADAPQGTLAERLAANPTADPATLEAPHDLLWYADLADALAPFYGNESAMVRHERPAPELEYDPPAQPPDPSHPQADSVPLAAAGVAQLVAFGAKPPPRCRDWSALVEGVMADTAVAEASVGAFPIPVEVSVVDGQTIPGTTLSIELGRDPRQLAEWSSYMGNCIGSSWYAEEAHRGQCVLMALRDDGRIVANLDIRRGTGGWQIHELRARFNDDLDPALRKHVKQWVLALAPPEPPKREPALPIPPVRRRGGPRRAAGRLPATLIRALTTEIELALATPQVTSARRTYRALARNLGQTDFDPAAAVIALKRLGPAQQVELLRTALNNGLTTPTLWRTTRIRPLTAALGQLVPDQREHDRLQTLTGDAPLPRTLRALVRRPEIAPAYAMDVVARAVRKAMGALAREDILTRSVTRNPSPELVCALVIATTCAGATVDAVRLSPPGTTTAPGFPVTDLLDEDGPWQQALPAAADLGAPVEAFGQHVAEHGLLAPTTLLGSGGWPALWRRAHR